MKPSGIYSNSKSHELISREWIPLVRISFPWKPTSSTQRECRLRVTRTTKLQRNKLSKTYSSCTVLLDIVVLSRKCWDGPYCKSRTYTSFPFICRCVPAAHRSLLLVKNWNHSLSLVFQCCLLTYCQFELQQIIAASGHVCSHTHFASQWWRTCRQTISLMAWNFILLPKSSSRHSIKYSLRKSRDLEGLWVIVSMKTPLICFSHVE